jgi:hypothetical protein
MVIKGDYEQPENQQFPIEITLFRTVLKDNHENLKNGNFQSK